MYIYTELQAKYDLIEAGDASKDYFDRMRRVLSWLKRAEQETDDPAVRFIFLWISFNACYACYEDYIKRDDRKREMQKIAIFFEKLGDNSKFNLLKQIKKNIDDAENDVTKLLYNRYAYSGYWEAQKVGAKITLAGAERSFNDYNKTFFRNIAKKQHDIVDIVKILKELIFRINEVRNQYFHGSATWRTINEDDFRVQTKNCCAIMSTLMPIIINDMLCCDDKGKWGKVTVPVMPVPYK
ncbi:MAG: hypothetical protein K0U45_00610 [Alphaproteobacteria bacterium]|nr:hypothetical protein [Alphaproteobacteria bacterium]